MDWILVNAVGSGQKINFEPHIWGALGNMLDVYYYSLGARSVLVQFYVELENVSPPQIRKKIETIKIASLIIV